MNDPTQWLRRLSQGEEGAAEELFPLLYEELHRLARGAMRDQPAMTLQTTALVHEAWIRLAGHLEEGSDEVLHFRALAATAMRSVLVDHARARGAAKRGGDLARVTLGDDEVELAPDGALMLDLDAAMQKLHLLDAQLARIAELRCFSGLEHQEIARLLDVSTKTAERRWKAARAWLQNELRRGD